MHNDLKDLQVLGYRVHERIPLEPNGPRQNWLVQRSGPDQTFNDCYVPYTDVEPFYPAGDMTWDRRSQVLSNDAVKGVQERLEQHCDLLLTAADYSSKLKFYQFKAVPGEFKRGGPGGYPFQETNYQITNTYSAEQMAQRISGHPHAIWTVRAVKAFSHGHPNHQKPEFIVLVPEANAPPITVEDASRILFGDSNKTAPPAASRPKVEVKEDAVYLNGIRVDRKLLAYYAIQKRP